MVSLGIDGEAYLSCPVSRLALFSLGIFAMFMLGLNWISSTFASPRFAHAITVDIWFLSALRFPICLVPVMLGAKMVHAEIESLLA